MNNVDLIEIAKTVSKEQLKSTFSTIGGVGCVLVTDTGNIYKGTNIDSACGTGFCAEYSAIAAMITNGENKIDKIIAINKSNRILAPCGRCRELMIQVNKANKDCLVVLDVDATVTLDELLPHHWDI